MRQFFHKFEFPESFRKSVCRGVLAEDSAPYLRKRKGRVTEVIFLNSWDKPEGRLDLIGVKDSFHEFFPMLEEFLDNGRQPYLKYRMEVGRWIIRQVYLYYYPNICWRTTGKLSELHDLEEIDPPVWSDYTMGSQSSERFGDVVYYMDTLETNLCFGARGYPIRDHKMLQIFLGHQVNNSLKKFT